MAIAIAQGRSRLWFVALQKIFESDEYAKHLSLYELKENETIAKYPTERAQVSARRLSLSRTDAQRFERVMRPDIEIIARHHPRLLRR